MSSLDDILAKLTNLPADKQKALLSEVAKRVPKFIANPGPQTEAYYSAADVLLYGGQAGGGKTLLELGWGINEADSGIIFRRELTQTDGLEKEGKRIIGNDASFNGSDLEWTWTSGRSLKLAGMREIDSWIAHAGRERDLMCVAAGTLVMLADGEMRAIEAMRVGDMVATLEGPHRVERVHPAQRKQAVRFTARDADGAILASQVQSSTHRILTPDGWLCADDLIDARQSTSARGFGNISQWFLRPYEDLLTPLARFCSRQLRTVESSLAWPDLQPCSAAPAGGPRSNEESDFAASARHSRVISPPRESFARKEPPAHHHQTEACETSRRSISRATSYGHAWSSLANWLDRCSSGIRLCGGRLRRHPNPATVKDAARQCLLLQRDAGQPTPKSSPANESAETQRHSRSPRSYPHPYTKETRYVGPSCSVRYAAYEVAPVGVCDVFDLQIEEVNHYITDRGIVNQNCFDEAGEFLEIQVASIMAWVRASPGKRTRVIFGSNPPRTTDGLWLVKWFAPWLDDKFPNPAAPGELRWAVYVTQEGEGRMIWVDGPGEYKIDGEPYTAKSYTFIPASLEDNPYRNTPEYRAQLQSLPEPLRSQLLYGKFTTSLKDLQNQCIPTDWVRQAQARWKDKPPPGVPMCAIGVDCSGGGEDPMVQAARFDGWYAPLVKTPAKEIPQARAGAYSAGLVIATRSDQALVVVDMGGGYGGPVFEHLSANDVECVAYKGAEGSARRSRDGKLKFANKRSAAYWGFREALDPGQPGGSPISLPHDSRLLAGLTAPTFEVTPHGIQVEPKVRRDGKGKVTGGVMAKLGFSPDEADAVVMAWYEGPKAATNAMDWIEQAQQRRGGFKVVTNRPVPLSARAR